MRCLTCGCSYKPRWRASARASRSTRAPLAVEAGIGMGCCLASRCQTDDVTNWGEWSRQAVTAMQAKNEAWVTRFALQRAPYRWDLGTAELIFERPVDRVVADICVVGTVSTAQGTFQWAWANQLIPLTAKQGLELVRTFGETPDLPRLVEPEWPGGR